ncbi:MAG: hypothetical protein ACRC0L_10990 [Angustibacter sp.]
MSEKRSGDWPGKRHSTSAALDGPPPKPEEFYWSAGLMFFGALLTIFQFFLVLSLIRNSPLEFLQLASDASDAEIRAEQADSIKGNLAFFGVISVAWSLMGFWTLRVCVFAPALGVFLAGLNSISYGMSLFDYEPGPAAAIQLIDFLVGLLAAALLFLPKAREYLSWNDWW